MPPDGMRASRAIALALLVGVFFVGQEAVTDLALGRPLRVANDVEVVLRFWIVWALLTPFVLMAVRRWPLDAKPIYIPIIAHLSVAAALASLHSIIALSVALVGTVTLSDLPRRIITSPAFVWGAFTSAVFYAVVLMVYTAVRFRTMSAALEAELTRSKLDTLRSQLRPHFLFNTLNAISVLVTEDADKARQLLLRLSTLLRRSLDEEAHEVSLRQELAFVDDYLEIQRGRFGDQLLVRIDIDPAVLDARVPVFLLQPLLENAIEHGRTDDHRTTIALRARREGDQLRVTLDDDGPGVGDGTVVREGIGLRNTRARLHHLYGAVASVQLAPASRTPDSPGTHVDIRIPFAEAPR
jgi:two-component system, LytTR family, sensor kinase